MKTLHTKLFLMLTFMITALFTMVTNAAVIVRYEFNVSGSFAPTTMVSEVTASNLLKGAGLAPAYWSSGTIAANSNAISDSLATAVSAGDYLEIQITPSVNKKMTLTSFSFDYAATAGAGINYFANFYGRSSVEGFTVNMASTAWPKLVNATNTLNVNVPLGAAYADLTGVTSFRIYITDRTFFDGSSHQSRVDNIQVEGLVSDVPEPTALSLALITATGLLLRRRV